MNIKDAPTFKPELCAFKELAILAIRKCGSCIDKQSDLLDSNYLAKMWFWNDELICKPINLN